MSHDSFLPLFHSPHVSILGQGNQALEIYVDKIKPCGAFNPILLYLYFPILYVTLFVFCPLLPD